jgi:hypothetical protein
MFVLCVVSKRERGKMQVKEKKEASTDEVQTENKRIQKNPGRGRDFKHTS